MKKQASIAMKTKDLPSILQGLHERLRRTEDEQEKAMLRALIGSLETMQAGATTVQARFPVYTLDDIAVETVRSDEHEYVFDMILRHDPSISIRYTATEVKPGLTAVDYTVDPAHWRFIKPYHDLMMEKMALEFGDADEISRDL